jgi:hypothetical protein
MWISNAEFCSVFIVLQVEDDKTSQVSENDASGWNFNERRRTQSEFVLLLLVRFSTTQKFLQKICCLKGNGFKEYRNSLNVGRIKLAQLA